MNGKHEKTKTCDKGKKHGYPKGVLGPVENLEEHVSPDWWRRIFNSLYLKTDADVVEDQSITRSEVDLFLKILRLSPEEKILDLCCGQGRHSLELARRAFQNVEGLDRSHYLIQKAKSKAKKGGLNVRFREGDARKLPYPADAFDVLRSNCSRQLLLSSSHYTQSSSACMYNISHLQMNEYINGCKIWKCDKGISQTFAFI